MLEAAFPDPGERGFEGAAAVMFLRRAGVAECRTEPGVGESPPAVAGREEMMWSCGVWKPLGLF